MLAMAVVVATVGREPSLMRLIASLDRQTCRPELIVISVPGEQGVPAALRGRSDVQVVVGARGLPAQRNAGVDRLPAHIDIVAFFDDDAVPADTYLEGAGQLLEGEPEVVGLTGLLLRDGAREKRQLSEEEIEAALAGSVPEGSVVPATELYGCNMVVRRSPLDATRFDEALPLYGWLEDLDFSRRLGRLGRLVTVNACQVVHEGSASGGRTQHVRFGYSSVANALYLNRKGSIGAKDTVRLVGRPLLANLVKATDRAEGEWRRQRLLGMAAALRDLIAGRCHPQRMLEWS